MHWELGFNFLEVMDDLSYKLLDFSFQLFLILPQQDHNPLNILLNDLPVFALPLLEHLQHPFAEETLYRHPVVVSVLSDAVLAQQGLLHATLANEFYWLTSVALTWRWGPPHKLYPHRLGRGYHIG
jgi:hypothetical protein